MKVCRVSPGAGHQADPFSIRQRVISSGLCSRATRRIKRAAAGSGSARIVALIGAQARGLRSHVGVGCLACGFVKILIINYN